MRVGAVTSRKYRAECHSVCSCCQTAISRLWTYARPQSAALLQVINGAAKTWGLECLRYEIKDIVPPPAIVKAMELQAEAERRKRAQVLESEGVRQATINESEAQRVRPHVGLF